jgi:4-hydroxy-4-methyl-2-oxoglutarate aldolase
MNEPFAVATLTSAEVATILGSVALRIPGLKPIWAGAHASGPARTVRAVPSDNLALHRAPAGSSAGDVIVVDAGRDETVGAWGDLIAIAAIARGVAGLVVDGSVRDIAELRELGFPVFAIGTAPHAAAKREPGQLGVAVNLRGVRVEPDDLIVADDDGVVVVPSGLLVSTMAGVTALRLHEEAVAARLRAGESTIEVLGLPAEP